MIVSLVVCIHLFIYIYGLVTEIIIGAFNELKQNGYSDKKTDVDNNIKKIFIYFYHLITQLLTQITCGFI